MDLLRDVETPSPPIDTPPFQSFQSTDASAFSLVLNASLNASHPDMASDSAHSSHISTTATPMFTSDMHPTDSMAMSMQLQPVSLASMDVVSSSIQDHISPTILSEFPAQPAAVAATTAGSVFLPDPPMNGIETQETQHQISSSPSAVTASSSTSLVSSPSLNGMVNPFMMGSSSLATALDGPRSRSASSASPGNHSGLSSELGFTSGNSAPSTTSTNETSFPFSSRYEQPFAAPQSKEDSPDASDPHLLVLGDMLKK
jgi:hypothetical protein